MTGKFSELDMYYFGQGTHYEIYKQMGAHPAEEDGVQGVLFQVWAPHAAQVYVIGTFNGWNENANEMERLKPEEAGIYACFIPGVKCGELYKYLIVTPDGTKLYLSLIHI